MISTLQSSQLNISVKSLVIRYPTSRRSSGGGASGGAKPVNKKTQSTKNPPESIPKKCPFKQRKTSSINPTFHKNPTGQKRGLNYISGSHWNADVFLKLGSRELFKLSPLEKSNFCCAAPSNAIGWKKFTTEAYH